MGATRGDVGDVDPLERWESLVDAEIREAQARGDFEDLPGHGEPLRHEDNPFAGDRAMAFHVLKNAGMRPEWMDLEREIVADRAALAEQRERAARDLRVRRALDRSVVGREGGARDTGGAGQTGAPRWWPFRRGRSRALHPGGAPRVEVAELEVQRRWARRAYLEQAARLDEKIRRHNAVPPEDLRWRERPRLTPDRAAEEFDAACQPVASGEETGMGDPNGG